MAVACDICSAACFLNMPTFCCLILSFTCRIADLLQSAGEGEFETCLSWLLRVTEAVLSTFTQAIASCQAEALLPALQQDYEQARQLYLQRLLGLAVAYGELTPSCAQPVSNIYLHTQKPSLLYIRSGKVAVH